MHKLLRYLAQGVLFASLSACDRKQDDTVIIRGDTTILQQRSGGQWGEVLAREAGRIAGAGAENPFGQVDCVAVGPGGEVAAFDRRSSTPGAIHIFDASGRFDRSVGREGSGPGEYSLRVSGDCLEFSSDGALNLLDSGNGRLIRYPSDGSNALMLPSVVAGGRTPHLMPGRGSRVFFPVRAALATRAGNAEQLAWTFVGADPITGGLDTLPPLPDILGRPPAKELDPVAFALPSADGRVLLFRTDRLGFASIDPHGSEVLVVERPHKVQRMHKGERDDRQRLWEWYRSTFPEPPPDPGIADVKPAFYAADVDHFGRVWLMRAVAADSGAAIPRPGGSGASNPPPAVTWVEQTTFAVFRIDGTFLGEVSFPVPNLLWVGGFTPRGAWTTSIDSAGRPELVRWEFDTLAPGR